MTPLNPRLLFSSLLILAAAATPSQDDRLSPVMKDLSKLIGGKWVATIDGPQKVEIEYAFRWHPDKKGIVGEGIIGKGSATPVYANVTLGWDAKAGKVFYLDTHNSDTVFFGHITKEGDSFLYEFGPIGGDPKAYRSKDRFVDPDTRESVILNKDGKAVVTYRAKRVK